MKKYIVLFVLGCFFLTGRTAAQGVGSAEAIGGTAGVSAYSSATGDITSSVAETLYIGPGNYEIDGTWEIYSKNVWISPDAVITGSGTIQFFNPSVAGGAASATFIDGNNNAAFINVNIELRNAANMVLADIAGPGGSWTDAAANAHLTIGADFKFAVANGDVVIGNYDMITATAATLSGYQPDRFVVTNGTGHLVHNNYPGAYTFPVGIAEGDYTPAAVNNSSANTVHVMVQDYDVSASAEVNSNGIDRTWNIYAGNASVSAMVDLQHNLSSNDPNYTDAGSFVTLYGPVTPNTTGQTTTSTTAWQSNNIGAGTGTGTLTTGATIAGASERSLTYASLATSAAAPEAFFTKSSSANAPLPVTLIRFEGRPVSCGAILSWATAVESDLQYYELQRSEDGMAYTTIARIQPKGSNSNYVYTDDNRDEGKTYYRLRMAEIGGAYDYSSTVSLQVNCGLSQQAAVFPNPVTDRVLITGLDAGDRVVLLDALGQKLLDMITTDTSLPADMSHVAAGTYLLQVMKGGELLQNIKLVKK